MICSCCYPLIFSDWCLTGEISKIQKKELPVQCLRLFSLTAVSNIKYSETKATSAFPSNDKWNCCSNVNLEPTLEGFNILYCMKLWRLNDGPWGSYYLLWLWVCIRAHNFWEYWAEFFFIWLDKSCGLQSPLHWYSQHNFYEDKLCDNFQAGASMRKGCLKMHPTEKYCNAKESLHWKKNIFDEKFHKGASQQRKDAWRSNPINILQCLGNNKEKEVCAAKTDEKNGNR